LHRWLELALNARVDGLAPSPRRRTRLIVEIAKIDLVHET
tara:strand:- start:286 stop:405 length:120 start_codon:yes stop_codon:yes gene_type:complete